MPPLDRITRDAQVMGGKPCLRGMRVTVGMVVGLVAAGHPHAEILAAYPYLEEEDVRQALALPGSRERIGAADERRLEMKLLSAFICVHPRLRMVFSCLPASETI